MPFTSTSLKTIIYPESATCIRLDKWLTDQFPAHSRSEIQGWIKSGHVRSPGLQLRPGATLQAGTLLEIHIPEVERLDSPEPEKMNLDILYEDSDLVAVNKRPRQVVHPAPGHPGGTVLNGMLFHYPEIKTAGDAARPGLVHRLDSGTSGVLLFARTSESLHTLQKQFKERRVQKTYHALCYGIPDPYAQILDLPIGRHPVHRQKRAVNGLSPRNALSRFCFRKGIAAGNGGVLEVEIETGRTHQIRVHLAHAGHPVLGDTVYAGKKSQLPSPWPKAERVMLHAKCIEFPHPKTGKRLKIEAPYAIDMVNYLENL